MRQFKFNHNDYVTVILTKEGAQHLTKKREELQRGYSKLTLRDKSQLKEGDIYKTQFWDLINDFGDRIGVGFISPFELGEIMIDSSLES